MQTNEKNLLCLFCHRKTAILNETHVVYDFDKFVLNFPITLMPKISRSFINVANKMVSCKDCIKLCELICEPIFFRESLKLRYNSDVSLMLSNMEIAEQNTLLSNSFQTQFEDRKHSTENASTRDNFAYIQDFRQKIKNYFTQKLTTSLTENDKEDSFELDDSSDVGKEKSICCKEAVITYYDGNNTDQLGIHYENPSTSYPNPELQAEVEARDGIRIRIRYVCSECSKIFVCEARFKEHLKNHDIQTKQKNLSTQTNMVMRNKLSSQDSSGNQEIFFYLLL
ncbi:unnamed protein product [Orchesella dallaii]|uniref:C2H2-type domain-containing protein n=1 Tax=Orchesella dallaii TaxID=48710 RepID=A0ABP1R2J2_9HEXA